jgi:hypothetical protein
MMINWNRVSQVAAERRRDDLILAEKERLIRRVLGRNLSPATRYQRWLARLGAQLVEWGSRLQARYANALTVSHPVRQER